MKPSKSAVFVAAAVILGQALVPTLSHALGERAGVAAAVRGSVKQISYRTPNAAVGRIVSSGDPIRLGDRITTGSKSGLTSKPSMVASAIG